MKEITASIGKNITKGRERLKLSKKELAEMLGVAPSTVSGWENGLFAPSADTLVALTEIFGITLDKIYGIDSEKLAAINDNELDKEIYELLKNVPMDKIEAAKEFLRFLSK